MGLDITGHWRQFQGDGILRYGKIALYREKDDFARKRELGGREARAKVDCGGSLVLELATGPKEVAERVVREGNYGGK